MKHKWSIETETYLDLPCASSNDSARQPLARRETPRDGCNNRRAYSFYLTLALSSAEQIISWFTIDNSNITSSE